MKGVYKITQLTTGKVYIGSSKEVELGCQLIDATYKRVSVIA